METITRRIELDLSSDELWAAITDRETLEAWLGDAVDVDIREGGTGVVVDDGVVREITVRTVDDGRGWSFEWQVEGAPASTVNFEISEADDGRSALTITETLAAKAEGAARAFRWDLCALLLWACTVAVAVVR
jgi:uncharacterized protein YndB with AHSA1/START domain